MIMNKILNILFFISLLLFFLVSISSFGGSGGPFILFDPYHDYRIKIPYYDFTTIIVAVISMVLLLIVLIGKFKKLPDLRQRSFSYNLLLSDNNFKKFDQIISDVYINDINLNI